MSEPLQPPKGPEQQPTPPLIMSKPGNTVKKWKEYGVEFILILVAVFLGSFAETTRENVVENKRQYHYIESMIEDLKHDTFQLPNRIDFISTQVEMMDSIQLLLQMDVKDDKEN